ncbi:MAG TPA: hypothetical protein VNR36_10540 [Pseudolysinimonas sp.]|nr:hypothetical protein [Pseudolysinimonas sp.]
MRNPWIVAQFAVAAVLLVISLIGVIGVLALDMAELAFSFQGGIQAFAIFPGLVVSLVVNALLMRAQRVRALSRAQRVLLVIEFVLIAALVVFHFFTDEAGTTFGLAIVVWPIVIVVAIVLAIVTVVRLVRSGAN